MTTKKIIITITSVFILFLINIFSPYRIEFIGYQNKIWGHKTNDLKKLYTGTLLYEGIELDLFYDEKNNILDVNHPPDKSINLSFSKYMESLNSQKINKPRLWLDIKNLKKENSDKILEKLVFLFGKYNFNLKNVLIESTNPHELLKFSNEKFRTSYYLPNNLHTLNNDKLTNHIKIIKQNIFYEDLEISFNFKNYDIAHKYFPKQNKNTWILSRLNIFKYIKIRRVLSDTTIKTVLINYYSFNGDR